MPTLAERFITAIAGSDTDVRPTLLARGTSVSTFGPRAVLVYTTPATVLTLHSSCEVIDRAVITAPTMTYFPGMGHRGQPGSPELSQSFWSSALDAEARRLRLSPPSASPNVVLRALHYAGAQRPWYEQSRGCLNHNPAGIIVTPGTVDDASTIVGIQHRGRGRINLRDPRTGDVSTPIVNLALAQLLMAYDSSEQGELEFARIWSALQTRHFHAAERDMLSPHTAVALAISEWQGGTPVASSHPAVESAVHSARVRGGRIPNDNGMRANITARLYAQGSGYEWIA